MNSRRTGRWLLWAGVCAGAVSIPILVGRIQTFNQTAGLQHLHFEQIGDRELTLNGYPPISLTDAPAEKEADFALLLKFGDREVRVPAKMPPALHVPNLSIYDEWVRLLLIGQAVRDSDGKQVEDTASRRVVLVSRRTPDGFDPETWGSVRRDEWIFDFYELKSDGEIVSSVFRYPRSYRGERQLRDDAANPLNQIPPLAERTWQFQTALHVIPKLNVPKYKFQGDAFDISRVGWPLPVSMFSVLSLTAGAVITRMPGNEKTRAEARVS